MIMSKLWIYIISIFLLGCNLNLKHGKEVILDEGLSYRYLDITTEKYSVRDDFKIFYIECDPKTYIFELLFAKDFNRKSLLANEYSDLSKSLLITNGSFFDTNLRPLGMQVKKGKMIKGIRNVDGGVFYLKYNLPYIQHTKDLKYDKDITFAIQGRPRLVENGKPIPMLKEQTAKRTFIAITQNNNVVIGVTEDSSAYADDLAKVLAIPKEKGGVGCQYALNMDGGSSSQLYLRYKDFQKNIPGNVPVPNALAIFKRSSQN